MQNGDPSNNHCAGLGRGWPVANQVSSQKRAVFVTSQKSSFAVLAVGAIDTSVLYAVKEVFGSGHIPFTPDNVYGVLPLATSYFLSRDTVIPTIGSGMARCREKLFAQMHHNASSAADFLNLPNNSVIKLGSKIEI